MSGLFWLSYGVLWLLTLLLLVAVFALLRHSARALVQSREARGKQGLAPGDMFPTFRLEDYDGQAHELPVRGMAPQLIMLAIQNCRMCEKALSGLASVAEEYGGALQTWFVYPGDSRDFARLRPRLSSNIQVIYDPHKKVMKRLKVPHTPYAVVIDPSGRVVQAAIVNGKEQLEWLLERMVSRSPSTVTA
jgi:peroxiredoxin